MAGASPPAPALAAVMVTASIDAIAAGPQLGQGMQRPRPAGVVRDANAGTITRSSESTGFGGRSRSPESVTSSTTTWPNGNSVERTVTRNCDKAAKTCRTTVDNERHWIGSEPLTAGGAVAFGCCTTFFIANG